MRGFTYNVISWFRKCFKGKFAIKAFLTTIILTFDYVLVGDYYIPDLKLREENCTIEKYGRLHRDFLKEK